MLYSLLLFGFIGVCWCQQQPTFDPICYDPRQMAAGQRQCYSDQGLVLHMANDPYNPDQQKEAAKNNALTSSPDIVCQNKDIYDKAIHCSLELSRKCTHPDYSTLLPSEDNLKLIQNTMCNNLDILDHACVTNNTVDLFDCGTKKYGSMTVADAADPFKATCLSYENAEECLEEEIAECGKDTVELQKQFTRLQAPIACQGGTDGTNVGR